jgi:hypothetical protein
MFSSPFEVFVSFVVNFCYPAGECRIVVQHESLEKFQETQREQG